MGADLPPRLAINPPLVNSSNPWATTLEDLIALYECPHTGAVTTRTSLLGGFPHDPSKHQFTLFDAATHKSQQTLSKLTGHENASLNTLGYSPLTIYEYITLIKSIATGPSARPDKGFIVSVTGTPDDVVGCYALLAEAALHVPFALAMEVNLSCPNIPGKPPPAYDGDALLQYLAALQAFIASNPKTEAGGEALPRLAFGLKTPPYTHATEYAELFRALEASSAHDDGACPVSFLTATNTLGSCLVLADDDDGAQQPALAGAGIGGMAGAPLHPLALGNVRTLRRMLDARAGALGHVQVVGVGGVLDAGGFARMRAVGAEVVGVGTGLGIRGVGVFGEVLGL